LLNQHEGIVEYAACGSEADPVLPEVRLRLGVFPFEFIAFHVMDTISGVKVPPAGKPKCVLL
jgi:hypothetical protein